MIGQIAAATSRMRVGSGGVMLPNHAPLMVAERFKVLEALFPGRIDLGIGRAPGTDPVTSYALRARQEVRAEDDFLERFQELMLWESGGFPANHPFRNVRAMPADVPLPAFIRWSADDLKTLYYESRMVARPTAGGEEIARWFWGETAAGRLLRAVRDRLDASDDPRWKAAAFGVAR